MENHILYNVTHDTVFLLNGYYIFGNTENFLPQIILYLSLCQIFTL